MYFRHKNTKTIHLLTLMNVKGKKFVIELQKDKKPSIYPVTNPNLFNDKVLCHFTPISKEKMDELRKELFPEPKDETMMEVETQMMVETT